MSAPVDEEHRVVVDVVVHGDLLGPTSMVSVPPSGKQPKIVDGSEIATFTRYPSSRDASWARRASSVAGDVEQPATSSTASAADAAGARTGSRLVLGGVAGVALRFQRGVVDVEAFRQHGLGVREHLLGVVKRAAVDEVEVSGHRDGL